MHVSEKESVIITSTEFSKEAFSDNCHFQLFFQKSLETGLELEHAEGSVFFFLQKGMAEIKAKAFSAKISSGMYVGLNDANSINLAPNSVAIGIRVKDLVVLNLIGGPVEKKGRLKYIDGCSDTLLISPSRLGEPCLNLLHFPMNTKQTIHHHPSFRFGIVLSGNGYCESEGVVKKLTSGNVFYIPPFVKHNFNTELESLNIVAFHPDSDWGPTDEIHPMINKTII